MVHPQRTKTEKLESTEYTKERPVSDIGVEEERSVRCGNAVDRAAEQQQAVKWMAESEDWIQSEWELDREEEDEEGGEAEEEEEEEEEEGEEEGERRQRQHYRRERREMRLREAKAVD
jgi:hypothetical protein